jgi:hypothetical protein
VNKAGGDTWYIIGQPKGTAKRARGRKGKRERSKKETGGKEWGKTIDDS